MSDRFKAFWVLKVDEYANVFIEPTIIIAYNINPYGNSKEISKFKLKNKFDKGKDKVKKETVFSGYSLQNTMNITS